VRGKRGGWGGQRSRGAEERVVGEKEGEYLDVTKMWVAGCNVAVCCSVLHCVAVCCKGGVYMDVTKRCVAVRCNVL